MTLSVRSTGDDDRSETDAALVAGVRRGDPSALEELFHAYATSLREYAGSLVHARDVAHELVQDLFLSIWAKRATWVVRGELWHYLKSAVKHRALNAMRRDRVHRRFEMASESGTHAEWLTPAVAPADALVQRRELAAAVRRALETVSHRAQVVFRMAREEECRYQDIAERLGISVTTVERDMAQAYRALRRELAGWRTSADP